jgi:NAD(P)-dependent dehydrogenase (short-subunit alcohol dehydrogenase family)
MLTGMHCLVIGGRSGLGAAVVDRLLADDATCHATSRQPIAARPGLTSSTGDVRDPDDIAAFVATAGDVDALVYCAGTAAVGPVENLTAAQWSDVFDTCTRGFGLAVAGLLAGWRAKPTGGCALAISSQAARRGQSLISAYTAAKAGLDGLVRALAVELAPAVRVNAVAPGIVPTEMIAEDFRRQAALDAITEGQVAQRSLTRIPLGRWQSADSVAAAVAYLLSPQGRDITGQTLAVDGGMTA